MEGKKILITGGTGSLGQALTKRLLEMNVDTIRIFSRNEEKQIKMENQFNDERLRFLLGDINDYERLKRAFENIDIVFHAAALKHVPKIEYNPFEAIKTNVLGSQNVIDACLHENVENAICVGTDKAVSPLNTYGATKLLMEKLFVTAGINTDPEKHKTKFVATRYGNVLASSGSVIPHFLNQIKENKKLTITDPAMTRFNITMNQALNFIIRSYQKGKGGEVFAPKLKAYRLGDLKNAIIDLVKKDVQSEIISVRPGEKYHESLINNDEIRNTFEDDEDYIILQDHLQKRSEMIQDLRKTELKEQYSSDKVELLTEDEIKEILLKEKILPI